MPEGCSFSATKPNPDTQRSASAALAACSWRGLRFYDAADPPAVASVMSAIRSCTATGSRAPGNGITSTRSRPWRSVAASTVSSGTSRSNTRQSPRCWCASISTRREYPSSGSNLRAESLPVMLSEAMVGWLWIHLCHRETSDTGIPAGLRHLHGRLARRWYWQFSRSVGGAAARSTIAGCTRGEGGLIGFRAADGRLAAVAADLQTLGPGSQRRSRDPSTRIS